MVDLQCPISCAIKYRARVHSRQRPKKRQRSSQESRRREKFSAAKGHGNPIQPDLTELEPESIDVQLEPALLLEFPDKADRLIGGTRAELHDDIHQGALDVFGHALGIATDIDMRTLGKPGP
jgi:hypothetical protein